MCTLHTNSQVIHRLSTGAGFGGVDVDFVDEVDGVDRLAGVDRD